MFSDVNDNGPVLDKNNRIGYISENEPIGTNIMTLSARDPDLPPNGSPFLYYLVDGMHKSIVSINKMSGLIKTTRVVDRETTPQLEFIVDIEDSGKPKMRSQEKIKVIILDQNDMPSTPRSARILVYSFNHKIPIGKIADVKPNDLDTTGDYKCKILKEQNTPNGLTIPNGCELHTTTTTSIRSYSYSISGNDGKHLEVISSFNIDFIFFDNQTVENSISVQVNNMTAELFISTYYQNFLDLMESSLDSGDNVVLYSLRTNNQSLYLTLAVKNIVIGYQTPVYIVDKLSKKIEALKQMLQVKNIVIGYSPCKENICDNAGICSEQIQVYKEIETTESQNLIFTSHLVSHDFSCKCSDSYTGQKCDKRQDPCSPNPCQSDAQCRKQGHEFQCICPSHREGKLCHLDKSDVCKSFPCKNGGSCRESQDGSSYFCLCRSGFRGIQCDEQSDPCRPNPCLYRGECISLKQSTGFPGYKCSCTDGRYGRHCEKATFGFQELSYMSFASLDAATNDISITFATTKSNALLLYNYGVQSSGRSDFIAIEIVRGKAKFLFGGSRTAITSIETSNYDENISNGEWHKIIATRNGRVMSLSIAKCIDYGDSCEDCRPGDSSCYIDDIGPTG